MSKVVKAVAIGALVGITGGAALGFLAPGLVGGSLAVGGIYGGVTTISAVTVGAISGGVLGAIQGGLSAAASYFVDKPSMSLGDAQARLSVSLDPSELGKWAFGETALGTDLVYAEKVDEDYVVQVLHGASHEIESFETLHVNDEAVSFSGASATGDWAGVLSHYTNLGTSGQSALGGAGTWPSTANGANLAHYKFDWTPGEDKIKTGIPTRITQVAKGCKVYDPRLDSTRGGTGTHRADDQTTWEYNDGSTDIGRNWALVVAWYLLGWRHDGDLVIGVGVDPDDVDWDSVITAANVCEETQDALPRFRVGGLFSTTNDHERIIQQLEAAVGGKVAKVAGKYYVWAPNDDLVSQGDITEDVILRDAGVQFDPSGPLEGLYNTIRGRYPSPDDLYQPVPYPEVVESTAVTEDGRVRLKEHDFAILQDVEICERVARYLLRRSRFTATWRLAVGPIGLLWQPFDVVTLNCQETNNTDQLVRITNMEIRPDGVVLLELLEEDSSIYDTTEPLGTPVTQQDPSAYDPSASVAVSNLALATASVSGSSGSASNAIDVSWDDPGGFVERSEVQFKPDASSNWITAPDARVDFTSAIIAPVEGGTLYDVRVRHVTIAGVAGAWSSDTITTGTLAEFPWSGIHDDGNRPEDNADVTALHAQNAVDNPEFEAGDTSWSKSGNWTIVNDPTNARRGSWCAKIVNGNSEALGNQSRLQCEAGDRILAQMFFKKTGGSGSFQVKLQFRNAAGSVIDTTFGSQVSSSSYAQSREVVIAPSGAATVEITADADSGGGTLDGFVDGAYMSIIPRDSDFAFASLAVHINKLTTGVANNGEIVLSGVANGSPDFDSDGFIIWQGSRHTITRDQGDSWTIATGASRSFGHMCFDTADTSPFTVSSTGRNLAFARKNGAQWEYDNNGSWASFTPTADMVSLGPMEAGGDVIYSASLWGQPILLTDAPQPGAGNWSTLIDDDGNAPDDNADVTVDNTSGGVEGGGTFVGTGLALRDLSFNHTVSNNANGINFGLSSTLGNLQFITYQKEAFGSVNDHSWIFGGDPGDFEMRFDPTTQTNMTEDGTYLSSGTWIDIGTLGTGGISNHRWRYTTGISQTGELVGTLKIRKKSDTSLEQSMTVDVTLEDT